MIMADYKSLLRDLMRRVGTEMKTRGAPTREDLLTYFERVEDQRDPDDYYTMMRDMANRNIPREVDNAINAYTGASYHTINRVMRQRAIEDAKEAEIDYGIKHTTDQQTLDQIAALKSAFIPAPEDITLYRGLPSSSRTARSLFERQFDGEAYPDNNPYAKHIGPLFDKYATEAFVSTSLNPGTAIDWAGNTPGLAYRIMVPKGSPILPLMDRSGHPGEAEVLLPPGPLSYTRLPQHYPPAPPPRAEQFSLGTTIVPKGDNYLSEKHEPIWDVYNQKEVSKEEYLLSQLLDKYMAPLEDVDVQLAKDYYSMDWQDYKDANKLLMQMKGKAKAVFDQTFKQPKLEKIASGINPDGKWYEKGHKIIDHDAFSKAQLQHQRQKAVPLLLTGKLPRLTNVHARIAAGIPAVPSINELIEAYDMAPQEVQQ